MSISLNRNLSPTLIVVAILAALCGLSLYLRIHPGYDYVFVGDSVWFRETDAYYYLRYIENMVRNFPHYNLFDPCILYPGGGGLGRPLFTWLAAGAALIVGSGNPTTHTIAAVSAYLPPILGTLTLIPVYFIGKELFNRWVGMIAVALVAILPGEFFHRSLLGFTDHHVAETLFSTAAVLFFIMAVKRFREREIVFRHILTRDWAVITKPLIYTLLAGFFLGIYLLTWGSGLLFAFILFAYLVIQFIIDHLRRRSTDYLCILSIPLFLVTLLMLLLALGGADGVDIVSRVSLLAAILVPIALSIISRLMVARAWKPIYYPLVLVGLAGVVLAVWQVISPALLSSILSQFSAFGQSGAMLTVMEATGILFPYGTFTLRLAWATFTTSFFIGFIALVMLAFAVVKEKSARKTVFLVWSVVMLLAVLGQRRFGYYYAVNAALLTGYFSWKMLDIAGLSKLLVKSKQVTGVVKEFRKRKKSKKHARHGTGPRSRTAWAKVAVAGAAVFLLVFLPNIKPALTLAGKPSDIYNSMTQGWYESCLWLKDNTPEPFGDPDFYYQLYPPVRDYRDFEYPDTIYGVLSWWDYGYFIAQIGRRVPNANPSQGGAAPAGEFFTAQDAVTANNLADQRMSKYIMIDHLMVTGKFYAMAEWAGKNVSKFFDVYYRNAQNGQLEPVTLFYPAYYESIAVRLYIFDGQAVVPTESIVILYEDRVDGNGVRYKQITGAWSFSTYAEAEAYIAAQGAGNYRIASGNFYSSPVPLDELIDYELVYSSSAKVPVAGRSMPGVKIFEYLNVPSSPSPVVS